MAILAIDSVWSLRAAQKELLEWDEKLHGTDESEPMQPQDVLRIAIESYQHGKEDREPPVEPTEEEIKIERVPEDIWDQLCFDNITRAQREFIVSLPWNGIRDHTIGPISQPNINELAEIEEKLYDNHYGMSDFKTRFLGHIANMIHTRKKLGLALLFVGAPGVGKTTLAHTLANAIGRPLARIPLAGIGDVGYLRGFDKTYNGGMPGQILNTIVSVDTIFTVILLEDVDKMATSTKYGNPQQVLIDLFGNSRDCFTDHYAQVPVDTSPVIFILTANDASGLSPALLEKLEVVHFPSYSSEEKVAIAQKHVLPELNRIYEMKSLVGTRRTKKPISPTADGLLFSDSALKHISARHVEDPGMLGIIRDIKKIMVLSILRKLQKRTVKTRYSTAKDVETALAYELKPYAISDKLPQNQNSLLKLLKEMSEES